MSVGTGLDPRVVYAWMKQEGAWSGKEKGAYNYLNVMGASGPVSFNNVFDALHATLAVTKQANMRIILTTAKIKPTPRAEIDAISATPWDANGYGVGGKNLKNTFNSLFPGQLDSAYVPPSPHSAEDLASAIEGTQGSDTGGSGIAPVTVPSLSPSQIIPNWTQGAQDIVSSVENALGITWLGKNWDRVLWILGGVILVIMGGYMLFKSQTGNTFTFES